jgi:carbon monoxide dehydrogenase subunit G
MPQITQSFTVAFPRADVWWALADVERVVTCMPGASLTRPPEGGKIAGEMRVKLGPIVAAFAGEGDLVMDDAAFTGAIRGQGMDRKNNSRVRAEIEFKAIEESAAATRVDLAVDFSLTGTLAQFSRGALVQEIAQRLGAEFAKNLEARMAASAAPSAVSSADGPAAQPVPAPEPPRELNALALLWAIVKDWFRKLFGRPAGGGGKPS